MSSSGQIQIAFFTAPVSPATTADTYRSIDYGVTWTNILTGVATTLYGGAISGNGKYYNIGEYSRAMKIGMSPYVDSTYTNIISIGSVFNSGGTALTSDYRIKTDVETLDETFTVDRLRPVKYKHVKMDSDDIGFIAHELQEHYPFLVEGEKDGENYQTVNYNGLIGILINEVQQMKKEIRDMKENVDENA